MKIVEMVTSLFIYSSFNLNENVSGFNYSKIIILDYASSMMIIIFYIIRI